MTERSESRRGRGQWRPEAQLLERLREAREEADLTQQEASERIGVSNTFISLIETGKRGMSMDTLQKMARAYGVSVHYLTGGLDAEGITKTSALARIHSEVASLSECEQEEVAVIVTRIVALLRRPADDSDKR